MVRILPLCSDECLINQACSVMQLSENTIHVCSTYVTVHGFMHLRYLDWDEM